MSIWRQYLEEYREERSSDQLAAVHPHEPTLLLPLAPHQLRNRPRPHLLLLDGCATRVAEMICRISAACLSPASAPTQPRPARGSAAITALNNCTASVAEGPGEAERMLHFILCANLRVKGLPSVAVMSDADRDADSLAKQNSPSSDNRPLRVADIRNPSESLSTEREPCSPDNMRP